MGCGCVNTNSNGVMKLLCIDPRGCDFRAYGYIEFGDIAEFSCRIAQILIETFPHRVEPVIQLEEDEE
jgi:hypothetical protein